MSKSCRRRPICDCGTPLKFYQAWFCSTACSRMFNKEINQQKTPEPKTPQEVRQFNKLIETRKKELETEEERNLVKSLTPEDDSPEAERRLREAICPNPINYTKDAYYHGNKVTTGKRQGRATLD
jgi:hypothetical protein